MDGYFHYTLHMLWIQMSEKFSSGTEKTLQAVNKETKQFGNIIPLMYTKKIFMILKETGNWDENIIFAAYPISETVDSKIKSPLETRRRPSGLSVPTFRRGPF